MKRKIHILGAEFFYGWRNSLEIRTKLDLNKMRTDISFNFKLFCVSDFPFLRDFFSFSFSLEFPGFGFKTEIAD